MELTLQARVPYIKLVYTRLMKAQNPERTHPTVAYAPGAVDRKTYWSAHPHFIGTYWGAVSTAFCAEMVELADAYPFAGTIFNDYSSAGYSLLKKEKSIVQPDRVVIGNGLVFGCILMKGFFEALSRRLKLNTTAYENYHRIYVP
ncbi:hypothetical protein SAY86_028078 [Trapa natans]|uniref:Uncharacterized protein n=1 Tax=Trapa natans TaxID=22666 RepID=A0AAN7RAE5_TRANT|nr:hypothetical protein SAY86_028078 [Trapa natans]